MLTREIMGALALGILWVNTLLIAAAAWKLAAQHRAARRALRPVSPGEGGTGLFQAEVEEGDGPDGELARYELEQVGRAGGEVRGRRTVHFSDRAFAAVVLGGVVSVEGAQVRVSAGEGEVWPARAQVDAAAACAGRAGFDRAHDEARKARGHVRKVTVEVRAGQKVWLAGELRRSGDDVELVPGRELGLLVSVIDPRAWLQQASLLALGFALAEILVAAAITALALVPPLFDGWPSKLGGLLGLAFFLGVQPLGTAVRDAVRTPNQRYVRGRWIEPDPSPLLTAAPTPVDGA